MTSEEVRAYLEDVTSALRSVIIADAKRVVFGGSKLPMILRNLEQEVLSARRLAKALKREEEAGNKFPPIIFVSNDD